jgi:hypothetical protein
MTSPDPFDLERFVTAQAPGLRGARRIARGPEAEPLDVVHLSAVGRSRPVLDGPVLRYQLHR